MLDRLTAHQIFRDDLNEAVRVVQQLPRVRFDAGVGLEGEGWIRKKHANGAVHEPATLGAMLAANRRYGGRTVFDLGALFGYFSVFALQHFEGAGVTAFDMHPSVIAPLKANVEPFAKVVHAAFSDAPRKNSKIWVSGFNIYEEPEGGWHNLESVPGAMKERGTNNRGRGFAHVDFTTLDEYCAANHVAPDLIKIDVEAYQAKAVLGGMRTFKEARPVVIIELHDLEKVQRMGTTNAETIRPLYEIGYKGYWCPNFRDVDARFEIADGMSDKHERLSLMVLCAG